MGTFPAIEFEKVNSRLSRCYSERVPLNSVLSKDAPQSPFIIIYYPHIIVTNFKYSKNITFYSITLVCTCTASNIFCNAHIVASMPCPPKIFHMVKGEVIIYGLVYISASEDKE